MPNKMIPFPDEIKITTHSHCCYYGIYSSNKDKQSASIFYFIFSISIIMTLGRVV